MAGAGLNEGLVPCSMSLQTPSLTHHELPSEHHVSKMSGHSPLDFTFDISNIPGTFSSY